MLVKLPEQILSMLLSPGLMVENYRFADSRPGKLPSPSKGNSKQVAVPECQEKDIVLHTAATVSESEDDAESGSEMSEPVVITAQPPPRRVRFDEMVYAKSPPKYYQVYPKTPPRPVNKDTEDNAALSDTKETTSQDSTSNDAYSTPSRRSSRRKTATRRYVQFESTEEEAPVELATTRPRRCYPKTPPRRIKEVVCKETPPTTTMTPRRMSLRSAKKVDALAASDTTASGVPDLVAQPSQMSSQGEAEEEEEEQQQQQKQQQLPHQVQLQQQQEQKEQSQQEEPLTPKTRSRRTSRSSASPLVSSLPWSSSSSSLSSSRKTSLATPSNAASNTEKLQALHLLNRLSKTAKRDLLHSLLRVRNHGKHIPEHVQALVVDYPLAGNLLQLLSERPKLLEVVLLQLGGTCGEPLHPTTSAHGEV